LVGGLREVDKKSLLLFFVDGKALTWFSLRIKSANSKKEHTIGLNGEWGCDIISGEVITGLSEGGSQTENSMQD
jgi:hypothetical protein